METAKIETRLEVKLEAGGDTAELYLYGVIRQAYPWEDDTVCISAQRVLNQLQGLKGKNINVHINSGGGDVFESIAICNLFKQHDGEVNMYIDSRAGSGASVIVTAGKNVYMYRNCMQMIHNAWAYAAGNAKQLRKVADDLDKISEAACESYKTKFVGTDEELKQLLDEETWLTAKECVALGLCTQIIDEPAKEEKPPQASVKETLLAKYQKNIPTEATEAEPNKPAFFHAFKK